MKRVSKRSFRKTTHQLPDNHTWKAPPGYKIFVIDRGAASFNFPASWVLTKLEPAVEILDGEPPNDNARIMVTIWNFPADVDWNDLPLGDLLVKSTTGSESERDILEKGAIIKPKRPDLELAWTEHRFLDPVEKREAFSRIALARFNGIHLLITFDYWVDDQRRMRPVWDELLRSLQMGRKIADPLKGDVLH
jgi:hypothetical protein